MTFHYRDPDRADNPTALPDLEVFRMTEADLRRVQGGEATVPGDCWHDADGVPQEAGWYHWPCFPGCLPDGDPVGPFETETAALADARSE
jgi:hypothetical protein